MLFRKSKEKLLSIDKALTMVAGKNITEQVLMTTPDRRFLLQAVAREFGTGEAVLMKKVAAKLKLPFVCNVVPMEIGILKPGLTFNDFKRRGAIAVTLDGMVRGVICVDPAQVQIFLDYYPQMNVYLGCWSSIARALDESEKLFIKYKERLALEKIRERRHLAQSILEIVLAEADSYGSSRLEIIIKNGTIRYLLKLPSGKLAVGTIDDRVVESFETFLAEQFIEDGKFEFAGGSYEVARKINHEEVRTYYIERVSKGIESSMALSDSGKPSFGVSQVAESEVVMPPPLDTKRLPVTATKVNKEKVLIIDDNLAFSNVLERFLRRSELQVVHALNAKQAIEMMKSGQVYPNLIVCDVYMPEMNGIEFLNWIRRSETFSCIPVIALTSAGEVDMEIKLLEHGADAFVCKSEDPRVLCAHVTRLLERFKAKEAA